MKSMKNMRNRLFMTKEKKRCICVLMAAVLLFGTVAQNRVFVRAEDETDSSDDNGGMTTYTYQAENYYEKTIDIAADMQPGESISFTLGDDFTTGTYTLSVNSCGNRTSFDVSVNEDNKGSITRTGTGFGQDEMTLDSFETTLSLKTGDVITITDGGGSGSSSYGWVDYIQLVQATEYTYQAEDYYSGTISENVAADMQPGESITISLGDYFNAGTYKLSVYSCGNRESFTVKVGDSEVGSITRTGTGFGQDQMTLDSLATNITLEAGNTITLYASDSGYGWVDYLVLENESESVTSYTYEAENTSYTGSMISIAADLQPNGSISIDLDNNEDYDNDETPFESGTYALSVSSNGNRDSFTVQVNGATVGTLNRTGNGAFTQDGLTLDTMMVLTLDSDDTITIVDPGTDSNGDTSYGWVDYIYLEPITYTDNATEAYITSRGGSLRMDLEDTYGYEKTSLRFGYYITIPEDCSDYSWSWVLSYKSESGTKTQTVKGVNYSENADGTITSNAVITEIPSGFYETDFTSQLTVIYTHSDGSKLTVVQAEPTTRSVETVANCIIEKSSDSTQVTYAQGILSTISESTAGETE